MLYLTRLDANIDNFIDRLLDLEERLKLLETHALTSQPITADQILLQTRPIFHIKNYGANGNGVDDDYSAIQATFDDANAYGGYAYIPEGTFPIGSDLSLGNYAGILSDGYNSVLKATAAINVLKIINVGGSGNRYGRVGNFRIDGNSVATRGLYGEQMVQRHLESIWVENCTAQGFDIENCHNNTFISMRSDGCGTGMRLNEASSNNRFLGGNITTYSSYGIRVTTTTLGAPNRNLFLEYLLEQATSSTHALHLNNGVANTFIECGFGRCTDDTIAIDSASWGNKLWGCLLDGDRSVHLPVVDVDGDYNRIRDSEFQNAGGNFTLGDVVLNNSGDSLYISGNRWRLGTLTNTGSIIAR